jgi:hypothetical protein
VAPFNLEPVPPGMTMAAARERCWQCTEVAEHLQWDITSNPECKQCTPRRVPMELAPPELCKAVKRR